MYSTSVIDRAQASAPHVYSFISRGGAITVFLGAALCKRCVRCGNSVGRTHSLILHRTS